jgi:hypothetical protein
MADNNDELVSQFLMFTGSDDTEKAISYLEMAAGNLEQAVSLFMDHTHGGAGGAAGLGGGGGMGDEVRAPDATQTMRLMDDLGPGGGGGIMGGVPYMQMDPMLEEQLQRTAFGGPSILNARDAVNAAAAGADSDEDAKETMEEEDDGSNAEDKNKLAGLADMFAPPDHLIYKEGGFEGARTMAKDSKRWLLVNIQSESEFASHALNRDVWRDELIENLVREGFIFWQTVRTGRCSACCGIIGAIYRRRITHKPFVPLTLLFVSEGYHSRRSNLHTAISCISVSSYWDH